MLSIDVPGDQGSLPRSVETAIDGGFDIRSHHAPDAVLSGRTGEALFLFRHDLAVEATTRPLPTIAFAPPLSFPIDQPSEPAQAWRHSPRTGRFEGVPAASESSVTEQVEVAAVLRDALGSTARFKLYQAFDSNRSPSLEGLDPRHLLALLRADQQPTIGRIVFAHIGSKVPNNWVGPAPLGAEQDVNQWRDGFLTSVGD